MLDPKPCPFCGDAPRFLPFKAGFWTERVICDNCKFHLSPELWQPRASGVPASPDCKAKECYGCPGPTTCATRYGRSDALGRTPDGVPASDSKTFPREALPTRNKP